MRLKFIVISVIIFVTSLQAVGGPKTPFQNYKIFPSPTVHQIEPSIVRHPTNPLIMFASAYTISFSPFYRNEGLYITTNGGANWFGANIVPDGLQGFHNGDPGPVITPSGKLVLTHIGGDLQIVRNYANYSTNNGANWTSPYAIFSNTNNSQGKGSATIDDVTGSPYFGRIYYACNMITSNSPIIFAYTTENDNLWQQIIPVNSSVSGHQSVGSSISVGPNGQVYLAWASLLNVAPQNEDHIGFARSTNGGVNWTVSEQAYACNGIFTGNLPPWGIRVNGYPSVGADDSEGPYRGWIYVVTGEKNLAPAGSDPDIIFHRSSDGGQTWSQGIRVNQDAVNNGKIQYFAVLRVDEAGGINVIYYDTRNTPSNDSVDVYLSRSTDGGNSWRDILISNNKFYPEPVIGGGGGGNQGDNIGVTSGAGKIWPVWMGKYPGDNVYQTWTAPIDISSIGVTKLSSEVPSSFELMQNYPNPFNPETKVRYKISKSGNISLKLYDLLGRELTTLAEGFHTAGIYEVTLNTASLKNVTMSSGYYFYRLMAEGVSLTKLMILAK
jgi:hypothetical protein